MKWQIVRGLVVVSTLVSAVLSVAAEGKWI